MGNGSGITSNIFRFRFIDDLSIVMDADSIDELMDDFRSELKNRGLKLINFNEVIDRIKQNEE